MRSTVAVGEGGLLLERLAVLAHDQVEAPLERQPVAVLDHLRHLVGRVDVHERDRHVAEERLARQVQEHRAVLADGPQHADVAEPAVRLAQDVDALGLERVELVHEAAAQAFAVASAALPGILAARSWSPHSRCSGSSHHQRPARQSSPSATARVHGAQPMLGKPWSCSGL